MNKEKIGKIKDKLLSAWMSFDSIPGWYIEEAFDKNDYNTRELENLIKEAWDKTIKALSFVRLLEEEFE